MSFNFNVARTEQPPPGCYYDEYGQIQYKFKWYKIPSWKPQYRGALYGTTVTVVGIYFVSKILRRPVYASKKKSWISCFSFSSFAVILVLPASVTAIGVSAGFWYFLGKFFTERQNRLRDATISHYIQLHPEDFEVTRCK